MLQNTHLPLLKCIQLWGRWDLFILPSLHCHILTCATCSRENPLFLTFSAVTRAVGQCTVADNLHVPIKKEWNCCDHECKTGSLARGNRWWMTRNVGNCYRKYLWGKLPRVLPASSWCVTVLFLPAVHRLQLYIKIWHLLRNRPGEVFVSYIVILFVCISMAKVLNDLKKIL